jgi:hypothetical protein
MSGAVAPIAVGTVKGSIAAHATANPMIWNNLFMIPPVSMRMVPQHAFGVTAIAKLPSNAWVWSRTTHCFASASV